MQLPVGAPCATEPKVEPKVNPKKKILREKTEAPESIPITEDMRKWAAKNGVTVNLETETEAMLDHHRRHGNVWADWNATWRTWMRNSVKFEKRNGGTGNGSGQRGIFTEHSGGNQPKIFGAVPAPYTPKRREPV
jgi:hypothetical protein